MRLGDWVHGSRDALQTGPPNAEAGIAAMQMSEVSGPGEDKIVGKGEESADNDETITNVDGTPLR